MKRVLVTGGSGYIGRYLSILLSVRGYKVIIVDKAPLPIATSLTWDIPQYPIDLTILGQINYVFESYDTDIVIHLASYLNNTESIKDPIKYYENNLASTLNLIRSMKKGDRLIFSSTAAVYGTPWNHNYPVVEYAELKPDTPYAWSKFMCEKIIKDCCTAKGIEYVILRFFNVAGGSNPNKKALIPTVIDCLRNDKPIEIYGNDWVTRDGTAVRDYIHVEDVARAHLYAMTTIGSLIFNIGSGQGYTVEEVIKTAEMIAGKKIERVIKPSRRGDVSGIYADTFNADMLMGFKPKKSLEDIIRSEWESKIGEN